MFPPLSNTSIKNSSESVSITKVPLSMESSNFQSKVNSPNSFTEAFTSPDTTDWGLIIKNNTVIKNIKRNSEKYLLKKKRSLLFLKYLIICLTSSSLKLDRWVFTNISRRSAACKISFDDLPNFLASS